MPTDRSHSTYSSPRRHLIVEIPRTTLYKLSLSLSQGLAVKATPYAHEEILSDHVEATNVTYGAGPNKLSVIKRKGMEHEMPKVVKKPRHNATDNEITFDEHAVTTAGHTSLLFRCYQCAREVTQSSSRRSVVGEIDTTKPCKKHYCSSCIKKSYSIQHSEVGSTCRCLTCNNKCNCRNCRKARGLPARGRTEKNANGLMSCRNVRTTGKDLAISKLQPLAGTSNIAKQLAFSSKTTHNPTGSHALPKIASYYSRDQQGSIPLSQQPYATQKNKRKLERTKSGPQFFDFLPIAAMLNYNRMFRFRESNPVVQARLPMKKVVASSFEASIDVTESRRAKRHKASTLLTVIEWTPLDLSLNLASTEARIQIREYAIRFRNALGLSLKTVEELEFIGVDRDVPSASDALEGGELPEWVGVSCVQNLLLGLLAVLLADDDAPQTRKAIAAAMQEIKASGVNLNRMWQALSALRTALSAPCTNADVDQERGESEFELDSSISDPLAVDCLALIPSPLRTPPNFITHPALRTRSQARNDENGQGISVISTAQLVPVIVALIEATMDTAAISDALEAGVNDAKKLTKSTRECVKREAERWAAEQAKRIPISGVLPMVVALGQKVDLLPYYKDKKSDNQVKDRPVDRKHAHRQAVLDIDSAMNLAIQDHSCRSGPLGTDMDGRVYWVLSPGVSERNAASDFLGFSCANGDRKIKARNAYLRRTVIPSEESRREMHSWSWFLAVHGTKPKDARQSMDSGSDDRDERWWGIYRPDDIKRLAKYLQMRGEVELIDLTPNGLPSQSKMSDKQRGVLALAKKLEDYADLLKWRIRDCEDISGTKSRP